MTSTSRSIYWLSSKSVVFFLTWLYKVESYSSPCGLRATGDMKPISWKGPGAVIQPKASKMTQEAILESQKVELDVTYMSS